MLICDHTQLLHSRVKPGSIAASVIQYIVQALYKISWGTQHNIYYILSHRSSLANTLNSIKHGGLNYINFLLVVKYPKYKHLQL